MVLREVWMMMKEGSREMEEGLRVLKVSVSMAEELHRIKKSHTAFETESLVNLDMITILNLKHY